MRHPTFFIVGAARAGTTSLARYVSEHPEVGFARNKEPNFFVFEGKDLHSMPGPASSDALYHLLYRGCATTQEEYLQLFSDCQDRKAIGEASVRYLYYPEAAARLAKAVPDAKIIILLRDPVERLWSHYVMMHAKYHLEPEEFVHALSLEPGRRAAGWDYDWHYSAVSRYAQQVARYLSVFGKDNVRIYVHEDFRARPAEVLADVFSFIGVDERFRPDLATVENQGYWLRSFWLDKFLTFPHDRYAQVVAVQAQPRVKGLVRRINQLNRIKIPSIEPGLRADLRAGFAQDISNLADILGRRLTW